MVENHSYTAGTCCEYETLIGRIKVFVEEGIFLGDVGRTSGFLRNQSYDFLSPDFKELIDNYLDIERKRGKYKDSTLILKRKWIANLSVEILV
jgi:hypothetical protein